MIYVKMPEGKHYRGVGSSRVEMEGQYLVEQKHERDTVLFFWCIQNSFLSVIIKVSGL